MQLAYHPALVNARMQACLEDPAYRADRHHSLHAESQLPEEQARELRVVRKNVRAAYIEWSAARTTAILRQCRAWGVHVVVFPEYSVPWESLDAVAGCSQDLVVVAGTHQVDAPGLASGVYTRLARADREHQVAGVAQLGRAVCPVIHDGKIIGLTAKLSPAKGETIDVGTTWAPVELPDHIPGPMGVLVCKDFLYRESPAAGHYQRLIESARFLAVPSLTIAHSAEEFASRARVDAFRYGKPVFYSNGAEFLGMAAGTGTTITVDGIRPSEPFPSGVGILSDREEGVIVADVDLGVVEPGASTRYTHEPTVRPYAQATFVYSALRAETRYAELVAALDSELSSNVAAGIAFIEQNRDAFATAANTSQSRSARWRTLLAGLDNVTSVETIHKLTRELLLPPTILPPMDLRRAMARGALDAAKGILTGTPAISARLEIETRLSAEIDEQSSSLVAPAADTAIRISRSVRGSPRRTPLITHIVEGSVADEGAASRALRDGDTVTARSLFTKMASALDAAIADEPNDDELLDKRAACELGLAFADLNDRRVEDARARLLAVDPGRITPSRSCALATAFAQMGDLERATEVLDRVGEAPSEKLVAARRIVNIASGKIPSDLSGAQEFALAGQAFAERGEAAEAATAGGKALGDPSAGKITAAVALISVIDALDQTEMERAAHPVPESERGAAIAAVEDAAARGIGDFASPALRETLVRARFVYARLVDDRELLPILAEQLAALGVEADHPLEAEFGALAQAGDLDRLRERLLAERPPGTPDWFADWRWVNILAEINSPRAEGEAESLTKRWPRRGPVENLTARVLLRAGRVKAAVEHARTAYELMPGKGQRLLLARALLAAGEAEPAWQLLDQMRESIGSRAFLQLRAACAEHVRRSQSVELWLEYLSVASDDVSARLRLASQLYARGEHLAAADEAWRAFGDDSGRLLSWEQLRVVATLQISSPSQKSRLRQIAEALRQRFPGDPNAEHARVSMLLTVGEENVEPDFDLLVTAKLAEAIPADDIVTRLRAGAEHAALRTQFALSRYEHGSTSFDALCSLTRQAPALRLAEVFETAGRSGPLLSAAFDGRSEDLSGAVVLTSDLELLVLAEVGVLDAFVDSVSSIALFEDIAVRIRNDWRLRPWPFDERDHLEAAARALELVQIVDDEEGCPSHFLEQLLDQGLLQLDVGEEIRVQLAEDDADVPSTASAAAMIPGRLFELLVRHGVHDAVLRKLQRPAVSRAYRDSVRDRRERARVQEHGLALAQKVYAAIGRADASGRLICLERPKPQPEIPPLREGNEVVEVFLRLPLTRALDYRFVLADRPTWKWLTADLYEAIPLADPDLVTQLRWDAANWLAFASKIRSFDAQRVSLGGVVRALAVPNLDALVRLVETGITDAINPDLILRLARQYKNGLDGQRPAYLLDRGEIRARAPSWTRAAQLRMALSGVYASALVRAFGIHKMNEDSAELPHAVGLAHTLLERARAIDLSSRGSFLDSLMLFALLVLSERPHAAFKRVAEQTHFQLTHDSEAGRLLSFLRGWADQGPRNRAALARATREAWLSVDKISDSGPEPVILGALGMATDLQRHPDERGTVDLTGTDIATVAILSALWEHRPLGGLGTTLRHKDGEELDLSGEDMLSRGADALSASGDVEAVSGDVSFDINVFGGKAALTVFSPAEALLLRTKGELTARVARDLVHILGPRDGRLARALRDLGDMPDSRERRVAFARLSASSPWRIVRDDPALVSAWGHVRPVAYDQFPEDLDDLRELLSEPPGVLADGSLSTILSDRLSSGAWVDRPDWPFLCDEALLLPGMLPLLRARVLVTAFANDDEQKAACARSALHRLRSPLDFPAAWLAGDIALVRFLAQESPALQDSHGRIDLREELAATLIDVVAACTASPPASSFAAREGGLLRFAKQVVRQVAGATPVSKRDGIWLTYRMFNWLVARINELGPRERAAALDDLEKLSPPARDEAQDVLDPEWFSASLFEHRLATIVVAIGASDHHAQQAARTKGEEREPWAVGSPGLQAALASIAHRAPTPAEMAAVERRLDSVLPWAHDSTVADTVVTTLLHLDAAAILSLDVSARRRLLTSAPRTLEAATARGMPPAVLAAISTASALTSDEQTILLEVLESWSRIDAFANVAAIGICALYASSLSGLRERARMIIASSRDEDDWSAEAFGFYLVGVLRDSGIKSTIEEARVVLDEVERKGQNPVRLALGLARLAMSEGIATEARQFIADRATAAPYATDTAFGALCGVLGVKWGTDSNA
ncbi:MAG: hypothetical protein KF795_22835 [Labilithrix sp.]|nr:hypothetical protein [Labilithrix sp.]